MYTFTTAIGPVGISWNESGITRVELGSGRTRSTAQPPAWVRDAIAKIVNHLDGKLDTLADVDVDLSSFPPFAQKVYRVLRKVKPGKTITYAAIRGYSFSSYSIAGITT